MLKRLTPYKRKLNITFPDIYPLIGILGIPQNWGRRRKPLSKKLTKRQSVFLKVGNNKVQFVPGVDKWAFIRHQSDFMWLGLIIMILEFWQHENLYFYISSISVIIMLNHCKETIYYTLIILCDKFDFNVQDRPGHMRFEFWCGLNSWQLVWMSHRTISLVIYSAGTYSFLCYMYGRVYKVMVDHRIKCDSLSSRMTAWFAWEIIQILPIITQNTDITVWFSWKLGY